MLWALFFLLLANGALLNETDDATTTHLLINETYAVVCYGHGGHVAGALVLGAVLRRVDPHRSRTALVYDLSGAATSALAAEGLWSVVQSASFRRHGVNTSSHEPWGGRKLDLWALPFERALFVDLDLMILPSETSGKHLRQLWKLPLRPADETFGGEVAALPTVSEGGVKCFNTGMMLLRPHPATFARYEAAAEGGARSSSCPVGHDQPILNHVFDGAWKPLEPWGLIKATTKCGKLPKHGADAIHFFGSSAPWSHECAACIAADLPCSRRAATKKPISTCVLPLMLDAQRAWWKEVAHLPHDARVAVSGLLDSESQALYC